MSRNWIQTGLGLIALAIGLLSTFIPGLYAYMTGHREDVAHDVSPTRDF